MRISLFSVLVLSILCTGCINSGKKESKVNDRFTLSAICPERADEDRLRNQSVEEIIKSRKIPSVDFEFDGIVLLPSGYEVLDKVAQIMTTDRRYKLIIEGHTDEVGSDEYNDWLSSARANAIKSYLVSRDVYADSIKTYGYGKHQPLVKSDTPEARACNRRVKFVLTTRPWEMVF
jgi:Outer membrane protein and related peptidoglycan-associated (lipo)proteins